VCVCVCVCVLVCVCVCVCVCFAVHTHTYSLIHTFTHAPTHTCSAAALLYALTAGVSGYVSTTLYQAFGGQKWAANAVLTTTLFTGPFFCVFAFVNSVAWHFGSTGMYDVSVFVCVCVCVRMGYCCVSNFTI
jgi:hypothetical protein